MAILNQLSPGVIVNEVDLTGIVPNVSTSRGAYVGEFNWGPVMEPMLINDEAQLIKTFSVPTDSSSDSFVGTSFFSCANFLSYSGNMFVVRVIGPNSLNAGCLGEIATIAVANTSSLTYSNTYLTFSGTYDIAANAQLIVLNGNNVSVQVNSGGKVNRNVTITAAGANNSTLQFTPTLTNASLSINKRSDFDSTYLYANNNYNYGPFIAKYPAQLANGLKISVCSDKDRFMDANGIPIWDWAYFFDNAPGTSEYVANKGSADDEMHIIVIDSKGKFTGRANTPLEKFSFVSKAIDAVGVNGQSNYYKEVLSKTSQYLYAVDPIDFANTKSTWGGRADSVDVYASVANYDVTLAGGSDGGTVSAANLQSGWAIFKNRDTYDVSLLIMGASADKSLSVPRYVLDDIVEGSTGSSPIQGRKDSIVFMSPRYMDVVNQPGDEALNIVNNFLFSFDKSSSYAVVDSGWKYQFDRYNNIYRWVPLNADVAGLCAQTDIIRDPWWSPGGFSRGRVKGVTKLAWNPNQAERDFIYPRGVNPVVSFIGEGPVLFGDRTLQAKPSAFDRINVRRLFIVLEKAISKAAQYFLFEFNDQFTRSQFVATVEPYLRTIQGRRGIYDFKVVCDESNNTPDIIDRNAFVGDIYIKPARSINFIQLNFVAVRTGVEFSTVVGQF